MPAPEPVRREGADDRPVDPFEPIRRRCADRPLDRFVAFRRGRADDRSLDPFEPVSRHCADNRPLDPFVLSEGPSAARAAVEGPAAGATAGPRAHPLAVAEHAGQILKAKRARP